MQTNLISGISHLLELFISLSFFNELFGAKVKKIYSFAVGLILYAAAYSAFLIFDSTIINILIYFAINIIFAELCYDCDFKNSILSSLFLSVANTAIEFIMINVLAFFGKRSIEEYNADIFIYILTVLISKTFFFIISKAIIYAGLYLRSRQNARIPFFLLLYPIASIVILYTFWIISVRYKLSQSIGMIITVSSFAIILSVFLTFVFYGKTSKKLDELHKAQVEAERIQVDKAYYALLDNQNEMLKTITHDEKNHLIAIKALANNTEVSEYIDKIYSEIKYHSMFGNTNNRFLDLLLNKYKSICDSYNVAFIYNIKTANLSFIDAPDLITLISNILDNAVEAAKNSKEKRVELSINKVNNFDILTCSNSCDQKPHSIGKTLQTTKSNQALHGLGVKSIKKIVAKYNGEFDWLYNENELEFVIHIAFFNAEK